MKIIVKKNSSKLATIAIGFQAGSVLESQKGFPGGTAHFLEHFIFKGTEKRKSFELSRQVAFYGGDINAYTGHEQVVYFITIPVDHFENGVEILHDMISNPSFPHDEFEKERQVIQEERASYADSISSVMAEKLFENFYSNYQRLPIIGTEESIDSISLDDVKRFYNSFYQKDNMLISVSSSKTSSEVENIVEKYFGKQNGVVNSLLTNEETSLSETKEVDVLKADLEQNHVFWAWPSTIFGSKEHYSAAVLSAILGGGMDSRLFQEVRENANLVYSISCENSSNRTSGMFSVSFSTRPQNFEKAKTLISEEIEKITKTPPSQEELERSKNKILTSIYRGWQNAEGSALKVIDSFLSQGKLPSLSNVKKKLDRVSEEEVRSIAEKIFSTNHVMVVGKKI